MKKTTPSGLRITYAPFWLQWIGPGDGGPERYPYITTHRPTSTEVQPLSESEALAYWHETCFTLATFSYEAQDYIDLLRNR
jgi:hypothetical protein